MSRLGPAPLPVQCCDGCAKLQHWSLPAYGDGARRAVCTGRRAVTAIRDLPRGEDGPVVSPSWCPHREAGDA